MLSMSLASVVRSKISSLQILIEHKKTAEVK